jgi:anti-sigma factor RsiW
MHSERYQNSIADFVDGTITPIRRVELETHLAECAECRALVADLEKIRDAAGGLDDLVPPDRVWLQLAGRLRQEGRISEGARSQPVRRFDRTWLAAAAALVIAAGASILFLVPRTPKVAPQQTPPVAAAPAPGNAVDAKSVESVQNEVEAAQAQFEKAISDLERVAKANEHTLDPATAATIDKNLGIVNQAIDENRAAVKAEPASAAARETLFDALRQKVTLLQDTIALMNEMRKGNNAGAAQMLNKS